MLSGVYQQSSDDNLRHEKWDPDNRLLAKTNRRRLDFESKRDTLLIVAGNLDRSFAGRAVDLVRRGTANPQPYSNRRTVYGVIDRNDLLALFQIFDFANPDITTAQRDATTVPQQALFFLNSSFVMEQACKMLTRPAFERLDDDAKRVRYLYQLVYQRDPRADEIQRGLRFLQARPASKNLNEQAHEQPPLTPQERYAQVLLMPNELMFMD